MFQSPMMLYPSCPSFYVSLEMWMVASMPTVNIGGSGIAGTQCLFQLTCFLMPLCVFACGDRSNSTPLCIVIPPSSPLTHMLIGCSSFPLVLWRPLLLMLLMLLPISTLLIPPSLDPVAVPPRVWVGHWNLLLPPMTMSRCNHAAPFVYVY